VHKIKRVGNILHRVTPPLCVSQQTYYDTEEIKLRESSHLALDGNDWSTVGSREATAGKH
jgi:hypothetical protein